MTMVVAGAEILMGDFKAVVAFQLHLVLLESLDDGASQEDDTYR
jgi:hypothetical protein